MESMGQNQVTQPLEAQVSETVNVQTMTTNSQYHGDFANSCQGNLLISANSFEFNAITSLSDDSGVPLTNSSISSGDSIRLGCCKCELELVESDGEVSQFDSLENCSDGGMSAENFNTLKKGPIPPIDPSPIDPPPEFQDSPHTTLLRSQALQNYASRLSSKLIQKAMPHYSSSSQKTLSTSPVFKELEPNDSDIGTIDMIKKQIYASDSVLNKQVLNIYDEPSENYYAFNNCKYLTEAHKRESEYFEMIKLEQEPSKTDKLSLARLSEIHEYEFYYGLKKTNTCDSYSQLKTAIMYSPMNHHTASNISTGNRPNSRNSLSSRLSSSHNSLCVPNANKADDSIFITQAMSHDALLSREISDFYNVPLDSDIYALPIDMIKPDMKHFYREEDEKFPKNKFKYIRNNKKRRRNIVNETSEIEKYGSKVKISRSGNKRHSVPENLLEPMHMTLDEVKHFYHTLYSNTSEVNEVFTSENSITKHQKCCSNTFLKDTDRNLTLYNKTVLKSGQNTKNTSYHKKNKLTVDTTPQKDHNHNSNNNYTHNKNENKKYTTHTSKKSQFSINLKQKLCSIFRFRKSQHNNNNNQNIVESLAVDATRSEHCSKSIIPEGRKFCTRALPPLPSKSQNQIDKIQTKKSEFNSAIHFASNIEKVKNYGWYWGPISSEAAEKVLLNEPDGSFIVRDSSDDHYIFSLSFKLNSCVRHVRIEQDQGTFSFGTYAKFKSQTITEFIEKAVEHSRSGRYLFFLHRRPEHGPMRVQLTNPVSRFKHIQSLQHMCRFVVLKAVVRKDLVQSLPLPRRLLDYLSYKHCYSEQIESDSSQSQASTDAWL